jgi:hypothetical protein
MPDSTTHLSEAKERFVLEGQRTYIAINGAGAIALLTFMQAMWDKANATPLRIWILFGVLSFVVGVVIGAAIFPVRHWAYAHHVSDETRFVYRLMYRYMPALTLFAFLFGIMLPMYGVWALTGSEHCAF